MKFRIFAAVAFIAIPQFAAMATEAVSYTYDAQGRLIRIVKSGSINNGTTVQYVYDKAGNRVRVTISGAPNG